jgi:hypothetical protein
MAGNRGWVVKAPGGVFRLLTRAARLAVIESIMLHSGPCPNLAPTQKKWRCGVYFRAAQIGGIGFFSRCLVVAHFNVDGARLGHFFLGNGNG